MKKILVPCDFSAPSINAYRLALDVAAQSGGEVHLINVIELPAMPNTVFAPVQALEEPLRKEISGKAQRAFQKLAAKYPAKGVEVTSGAVFGTPAKAILAYVKKNSIDTILIGSHGSSGIKNFFVGSTTEKIVRTAPVPVIVVSNFYKGPVKKIVFPISSDTLAQDELVRKVKELQSFFDARLYLVRINTPANFTPDTITHKEFEAFARKHKLKEYTFSVFNYSYEEEGIIQYANSIGAHMIAMGTHGRKGLARMMYGSKTEGVAQIRQGLMWTYVMKDR